MTLSRECLSGASLPYGNDGGDTMDIPSDWAKVVVSVYGEQGEHWLSGFAALVHDCEQQWGLKLELPTPYKLSFNYVVPAVMQDGTEAVLKLGVPCKETRTELAALRIYAGSGAVRVLAEDVERGAMLIEQVRPGLTLAEAAANDDEAIVIAAQVMKQLAVAAPEDSELFPTVADWAAGLARLRLRFDGGTGPIPESMVKRAEETFYWLLNNPEGDQLLLHGDLHHYNILAAEGTAAFEWKAIDPKGVIGEAEYGTIQLLLNELPPDGQLEITRRRVELLCRELRLKRERLLAWGYSHAVLAACWCTEDRVGGAESALQIARCFEQLQHEL